MGNLLNHLAEIERLLRDIRNKLNEPRQPADDVDEIKQWLDAVEVQRILRISTSTLYRLKKKNILNPYQLGGRDYYDPAEIRMRRNQFLK